MGFLLGKSLGKSFISSTQSRVPGLCGEAAVPSSAEGLPSATSPVPSATKHCQTSELQHKPPSSLPPSLPAHPKPKSPTSHSNWGVRASQHLISWQARQPGPNSDQLTSSRTRSHYETGPLCPPGWKDTPRNYESALPHLPDSQKSNTSPEKGEPVSFSTIRNPL